MRQGASRHALKARRDDLYETPRLATLALLRVEKLAPCIWEPAAGRGAIARELIAAGHHVEMTDLVAHPGADAGIVSGVDFLMETSPPRADIGDIVTNPPFKIGDEFVRRGLSLAPRVIVLLRLMAIEGRNRSDLVDRHLRRVWAGVERLPAMHREGWEGNKLAGSGAPFAWFVFEAAPRGDAPIELRRMSWRG